MLLSGAGAETMTGAILTPYNAQVNLIKELIKSSKQIDRVTPPTQRPSITPSP
jgi:hypothetical protein